jgi:hypothetical protein
MKKPCLLSDSQISIILYSPGIPVERLHCSEGALPDRQTRPPEIGARVLHPETIRNCGFINYGFIN